MLTFLLSCRNYIDVVCVDRWQELQQRRSQSRFSIGIRSLKRWICAPSPSIIFRIKLHVLSALLSLVSFFVCRYFTVYRTFLELKKVYIVTFYFESLYYYHVKESWKVQFLNSRFLLLFSFNAEIFLVKGQIVLLVFCRFFGTAFFLVTFYLLYGVFTCFFLFLSEKCEL